MSTSGSYDVIVVGAGLAGALMAHYLADGGMHVVVLEATSSPGGTAKSKYLLSPVGTPEPFGALESRWGRGAALQIWDLTYENLCLLTQCLEKTDQNINRTGSIRSTAVSNEIRLWQNSVTDLQELGYEIEIEDASAYPYKVVMHTFDDIVFDSQALIQGLLDHHNIIVEYGIEVHDIKCRDTDELAIWAYKRYLWGKRVVLANGIHAIQFHDDLKKLIRPRYTHTIDAHNVPTLEHPMILQCGDVNIIPAGDSWHITGWGINDQLGFNRIVETARQHCPQASVSVRYTGWVAQSTDKLPFIGILPNKPNVYTINGLGAFGASWVFVAAQQLANLILNNKEPRFLDITRLQSF